MKGEALLWARTIGDPRVPDVLLSALDRHMETGESLDQILGLHGAQGVHSPRRTLLRKRRDDVLMDLVNDLGDTGMTPWQASGLIAEAIEHKHYSTDELREIAALLGENLITPKAIYKHLLALVTNTPDIPGHNPFM